MVHKVIIKSSEGVILYDENGKAFLLTSVEFKRADQRFKKRYASSAMLKDLARLKR